MQALFSVAAIVVCALVLTLLNQITRHLRGDGMRRESFSGKNKRRAANFTALSADEKMTYAITLILDMQDRMSQSAFWTNLAWNCFAILTGWLLSGLIPPVKLLP